MGVFFKSGMVTLIVFPCWAMRARTHKKGAWFTICCFMRLYKCILQMHCYY